MFKKTNNKPVVITIVIAFVIGIICGIIYFFSYYQPETEFPPELIIVNPDGTEVKLLLKSYNWTYKGELKTFDLGIEDITKYNFETENIEFYNGLSNFYMGSKTVVKVNPKYKNDGFICSNYNYTGYNNSSQYQYDSYPVEPSTEFNLMGPSLGTTYYQIDLKSKNQGTASYIFKGIDNTFLCLDYIKDKEFKNVEDIKDFLSNNYMQNYLSNIEIDGDKVKIAYQYYVNENFSSKIALVIFAKMDNINIVEFDFLHDQYKRNAMLDDIRTTIYVDNIEPKIYNREGFESFQKIKIEELKAYLSK